MTTKGEIRLTLDLINEHARTESYKGMPAYIAALVEMIDDAISEQDEAAKLALGGITGSSNTGESNV